ncbi:DUF5117 domain-containing protein [Odoribacter sp. Z80]|uniref:DUF5117 and DUF5118 domain-containing protein n=1 Tax=Odoribacter sp. Z80 TaxID=2304575 RepID=UPI0013796722|nr:DUF5117 domain-containing protein [Odoribacter sp. Z80]NCE73148.1 DUF5117 domain-containing protein [Odoribacter sp. Z80]
MKRFCLGIFFMINAWIGVSQSQIKSFDEFYRREEMTCYKGILSVYCRKEKIYLEVPENLLGRELLLTAQVNRGGMMLGRPLPALGVFRFTRGEEGKLYLRQGKYTERMTDRRNPLAGVLANSNHQPVNEVFDVLTVNPDNTGYIIDITKALKSGKGWMNPKLEHLRNAGPDMTLKRVETTEDGVAFAFMKNYFYSYPLEAAGVKRQEGKIPVELGCMIRLLPELPLSLKYAAACPGYDVVRFMEYGRNPYGVTTDSVIQRWRLEIPRQERTACWKGNKARPLEPIVFYIDADCPKVWRPWIEKAVLDWNRAFEDAGFREALQVCMTGKMENTVKYRALISYDLSVSSLSSEKVTHPETGEILACRINIGQGVWEKQRERYLLQWGAVDRRILEDFDHTEVAGEILCSLLTREIGRMLGLKCAVMGGNAYDDMIQSVESRGAGKVLPGVSASDRSVIAGGYGYEPCRGETGEVTVRATRRETAKEGIRAVEYGISNLHTVYKQLGEDFCPGKSGMEKMVWLEHIHQTGNELYDEYLSEVAGYMGKGAEREVMAFLERYLFAPDVRWPSFSVLAKESGEETECERLACCKNVLRKMYAPRLARRLLQRDSGYTLHELYKDLHRLVFADFEKKADLSAFDLNLRHSALKILLEVAVEENAGDCDSEYQVCLYFELQGLREHFQRLAEEMPDSLSGRFYQFWQKKIEKRMGFE